MSDSPPDRGEIWLASLDPVAPSEQGGTRPVLVLSTAAFNAWPVALVLVVPLTTRNRGFGHHIAVEAAGLERPSFAMPEYLRSIAQSRLRRRLGQASPATVTGVEDWVRRIAGL
ncbi:MAG: type II toxin-antitoxin system PemK/MazF family toxin [Sporichthyaceae bacterium]